MIFFRQVDAPHHDKGIHWHVEFWNVEEGEGMFPVGTAYVVSIKAQTAQVGFILVADAWRRRGIATKLIEACKEKWPNLQYSDPKDY